MEKAYFAGGCFWCTEAIFRRLRGVEEVISGYSGGSTDKPSYEEVVSGNTGHVEAIEITFSPKKISYEDLLYVFLRTHDPTDTGGQGADRGSQYLSRVFYTSEEQKALAEKAIEKAQAEYDEPIVTEILPFENFYEAEGYHQDYYERNRSAGYCRLVIDPKIKKLEEKMSEFIES